MSWTFRRVVLAGYVLGGMLVLWLAARPRLPRSILISKNPLRVKAIVDLDAPPDLAAAQPRGMKFCPVPGISQFMGIARSNNPNATLLSAMSLLPIGLPQTMVAGGFLKGSSLVSSYEAAATSKGDW